jgi:two-component system, NtrC family, nitrogen regulation response regulator NtrX
MPSSSSTRSSTRGARVDSRDAAGDAEPLELRGDSGAIRRVRALVRQAASSAGPILVLAERGFDVGAVACEIHRRSAGGPFVALDCESVQGQAAERALFGDAPRRASASLECVADGSTLASGRGGTILLRSIVDLSAGAQVRLARLLRDGEMLLGSSRPVRFDGRIVAAAEPSIDADVRAGRLRRDLHRRLAAMTIVVPPLRERPDDVRLLAAELAARIAAERGGAGKPLTPAALTLLAALPWRENLQELRVLLGRVVPESAGAAVRLEDVLACLPLEGTPAIRTPGPLREARRRFEREYIAAVLRHHGGRVPDAAVALGIQRTNLYRKARQLGLDVSRRPEPS